MLPATDNATARHDFLTVAAVAVIVYSLSSLLHEAVGHGGACLAVRGVATELSSMHFECNLPVTATTAERIVAAGGTVATLLGGMVALQFYRLAPASNVWRYALWLFAAINLMQGTGYFLFSGVGNVGDWAAVTEHWKPEWAWRAGLALIGFGLYLAVTIRLFNVLHPFVGGARPRRFIHAIRLAVLPYFVGGALEIAAGARNPGGVMLVLMSGAAASLGGTSGLLWGPQMLRGPRTASDMLQIPVSIIRRSWPTILVAIVVAAVFIIVFGRGLTFS
ncbi:MAG: hypothetical protein ABJE47_06150 [bacterium]